ncbi:hypothetical protein LCGC14_2195200, partial [marine sediment metagenome]
EPLVKAEIETPDEPKHPMTWMLIDGRNRRAACKLAGIEPSIRELNGEDPTAYVLSANIHRRHMTKGQRAMAVAMIYPGGSGKGANPKNLGLSGELIRQARVALQYAPDLAANVLTGAESLDAAYKTAGDRKTAASSEETQLDELRDRYPDLADKIVEGELGMPAALVEASNRDAKEREQKETTYHVIEDAVFNLSAFVANDFNSQLATWLDDPRFRETLRARVADRHVGVDFKLCLQRLTKALANMEKDR